MLELTKNPPPMVIGGVLFYRGITIAPAMYPKRYVGKE